MKTPDFWYIEQTFGDWLKMLLLTPFSWVYYAIAKELAKRPNPYDPKVPVLCVGNIVAGGAGKTPTTIAMASFLKAKGKNVHIISRGFGGSVKKPTKVDPDTHTADIVGDEPLMMAKKGFTVWVSGNRRKSAYLAVKDGAEIIIMDDGHQNHDLKKTVSLIVVDGLMGFGNKHMLPAGPLREPIKEGLSRADAMVVLGEDKYHVDAMTSLPVIRGNFVPTENIIAGMDVFGFAGMGRPEKFVRTLYEMEAQINGFDEFPDHYDYNGIDIEMLYKKASRSNSILVTTRKDYMRIPETHRQYVNVVDVVLEWDDETVIEKVLSPLFSN